MKTSQHIMDNVADQIANSATDGYKKKQVNFSELLRNEIGRNQVEITENGAGSSIGIGSKAIFSKTDFRQGMVTPSAGSLHLAVEGRGFFGVFSKEGDLMLTRNGAFHQNADGSVTDDAGNLLSMELSVPLEDWPESSAVRISEEGVATARNAQGGTVELGRVILYVPGNSDELVSIGEGRYLQPDNLALYNSADNPERGFGGIRQNALEHSNVDTIQSMTDMIVTQRSYQMNAKSVTTADDMLEVINTII
jgi:flagellar basal-body rod protein FlgG